MKNFLLLSVLLIASCSSISSLFDDTYHKWSSDELPDDYTIVATYGSGYSDWEPWQVTITRDGKAVQEIYTYPGGIKEVTRKEVVLQKEDLLQFVNKVKESRFFSLNKRYSYSVTDHDTLILDITMYENSHKVMVYAPFYLKNNDDVKRFMKVWNEVLRKVPSPNVEKTLNG